MLWYMYMHWDGFTPFNTPFAAGAFGLVLPIVIVVALMALVLKGFALWYAARGGQKKWFIALLVINTAGILEIVYLLFFRPDAPYKHMVESKGTPPHHSSSTAE